MIKPTILIFGPTAAGKTSASIELALAIGGEIISADSMQVYRYMDIGTAKATKDEMKGISHHLIDVKDPDEEWTVSDFISRSKELEKDIRDRGNTPIIVGGTGLYLNAYLNGYSFPIAKKDDKVREELSKLENGELFAMLREKDPASSLKISCNDKKRMIRALEVFEVTGSPISELQKKAPKKADTTILFCINNAREKIYENIGKRVDRMIERGLADEVKGLIKKGYPRDLVSMQALGYKEIIDHLNGGPGFDETIELIKKKTRNFARRQLTWFRRFEGVRWIEAGDSRHLEQLVRQSRMI